MEGPRGHRGTDREPAIVNLAAGDDSGCSLDPPLPIEGSGRWAWRVLGSGCGREFVQRLPVRIRFNPDQDPLVVVERLTAAQLQLRSPPFRAGAAS